MLWSHQQFIIGKIIMELKSAIIVIDVVWYNCSNGIIGVVFGYDSVAELYHGYMGIAKGLDLDEDIKLIIDDGCRLNEAQTKALFQSNLGCYEDIEWIS